MKALQWFEKVIPRRALFSTPRHSGIFAIALPLFLVVLLCATFSPRWETNDDVAMSMIAHGYGAMAYASPKLVFSNVLWGYFASSIPPVHGIVGYSIVTLGSLVLAGMAILYGLLLQRTGLLAASLVIGLALARATLFPQFTINSGLLAVAGVVLLLAYQRHSDRFLILISAVSLMLASFLVRWMEFAFVMLVALPMLDIRHMPRSWPIRAAFATLIVACAAALMIDDTVYRGSEWQLFNALNPARVPFTDYGVVAHFAAQPELLGRYGLSVNDLELLSKFFFLDPQLYDPRLLAALLHELPGLFDPLRAIGNGIRAFGVLYQPELLPLFLTAAFLFVVNPGWATTVSWLTFFAAILTLGMMGRPGVTRIFYAPLILLVIAPILHRSLSNWRREVQLAVLAFAFAANTVVVASLAAKNSKEMEIVRASLTKLPPQPIVTWGGSFPYQLAYPVLSAPPPLVLQALGTFTYAPYSNIVKAQENGRDPLHLLKSGRPILIVAGKQKMELFSEYAKHRLNSTLTIHRHAGIRRVPLHTVRLETPIRAPGIAP